MICLGSPQRSPTALESEAAQLRALELFRKDFLQRFPGGIVLSELEYMGHTTSAPNQPGPLLLRGQPRLSRLMEALTTDFRRWSKDRDFRKCDAMGISADASIAELLEVTTGNNAASAIGQLATKLATLHGTVNQIHDLRVLWRPTNWRPVGDELFYALPFTPSELRYLCYNPTYRLAAPPGVVLYEVHILRRPLAPLPVPVPLPEAAAETLRARYRAERPTLQNSESWAQRVLVEHPSLKLVLRGLAAVAGVLLAVSAVILIFDPVPGDEAAAGAAASALLRLAMAG